MRALTAQRGPGSTAIMELVAVIISAILGWQNGRLGVRELQVMALVAVGWTAVIAAASVPYLTIMGLLVSLVYHVAVVAVPYVVASLIRRVLRR